MPPRDHAGLADEAGRARLRQYATDDEAVVEDAGVRGLRGAGECEQRGCPQGAQAAKNDRAHVGLLSW
jgi:hypothetical protein